MRTAERLVAVFCILAWRVFWMTMMRRIAPSGSAALALTRTEMAILDRLVPDKGGVPTGGWTLSTYLTKVARLGGYLARGKDLPPGNAVMWRGLSRLTDIELGTTPTNAVSRYG